MNVFDLSEGTSAKIVKVNVQNSARERLLQLGIKEGAQVDVLSFSLFSSSVLLGVGYARVAVRKELAKLIEVTCLSEPQKNVKGSKHSPIFLVNSCAFFKGRRKSKSRHNLIASKRHKLISSKRKLTSSKGKIAKANKSCADVSFAKNKKLNVTREK